MNVNPNSANLFPFSQSELLQHRSMRFQEFPFSNEWVVFIQSLKLLPQQTYSMKYVLFSAWNLALESIDSTLNMQDLFLLCHKV